MSNASLTEADQRSLDAIRTNPGRYKAYWSKDNTGMVILCAYGGQKGIRAPSVTKLIKLGLVVVYETTGGPCLDVSTLIVSNTGEQA